MGDTLFLAGNLFIIFVCFEATRGQRWHEGVGRAVPRFEPMIL